MGFAGWLNISDTAMPWKNERDLNFLLSLYLFLAGDALGSAGKAIRARREGAYGEQQTWNGGRDTIPTPSFYWQKDWQIQTARNKLLLELMEDMLESSADTKPGRKDLTQGQHNLL